MEHGRGDQLREQQQPPQQIRAGYGPSSLNRQFMQSAAATHQAQDRQPTQQQETAGQAEHVAVEDNEPRVRIVAALQELQLPHAKLLYILARMFKLHMISETQKLELKYRVLEKHQGLMDFFVENEALITLNNLQDFSEGPNNTQAVYIETCFRKLETFQGLLREYANEQIFPNAFYNDDFTSNESSRQE